MKSFLLLISLLFLTGVSLFCFQRTLSYPINTNLAAFLPDDSPSVTNLEKMMDKAGGYGNFLILIRSQQNGLLHQAAQALKKQITQLDWVSAVDYEKGASYFNARKLLFLSLDEVKDLEKDLDFEIANHKIKASPLYIDFLEEESRLEQLESKEVSNYYQNSDKTSLVLMVWPKGSSTDIEFTKRASHNLHTLIAGWLAQHSHQNIRIDVEGSFENRLRDYKSIRASVRKAGLIALMAVYILITLTLRNPFIFILLFFPLLSGLSLAFSLVQFWISELNLITVFLAVILFGLGVDYGVHLYASFLKQKGKGLVKQAIRLTLRPAVMAAATTSLSFLTLSLFEFRGFRDFGVMAFSGIVGILVMTYVFFYLVTQLATTFKLDRFLLRPWWSYGFLKNRFSFKSHSALFYAGVLLGLAGYFLMPALEYEGKMSRMRPDDPHHQEVHQEIEKVFSLSRSPVVYLSPSADQTRVLVKRLNEIKAKGSTIKQVRSFFDIWPDHQNEKQIILKRMADKIKPHRQAIVQKHSQSTYDEWMRQLSPSLARYEDIPQATKRYFWGDETKPGNFVFVYNDISLGNLKEAMAYQTELNQLQNFDDVDATIRPASETWIYLEVMTLLKKEIFKAVFLVLLGLVVLVTLDHRSLRYTIFCLLPLVLTMGLLVALMVLFGLSLNLFNVVVFPLLLGIGIDSGLYLTHRLKREGVSQIDCVWQEMSLPIALSGLTSSFGFLGMWLCGYPGLASLGFLAMMGIALCLWASLSLLPRLISIFPTEKSTAPSSRP